MHPKRFTTLLLALTLLLPCAVSADDALAQALARQLETNRQRYGIAGQALLVAHDDQVLFRGVDGEADIATHAPVTDATVFAGYSLAKLFASTLVMQLVERQELQLDAPISAQLPGLPARWQAIRVRDFLDHTSGVPEYFDAPDTTFPTDAQAVFDSLADAPLQFAPGTENRYTQTNYLVLAALLGAHAGMPYPQLVDERILGPLQLRRTWLGQAALPEHGVATSYIGKDGRLEAEQDPAWPGYALGHAALYTTLDDLARFLQAMTSGELVGKATLQRLWQPRTLPGGQRSWFAAGWEYGESGAYRQVGHDGGTRVRVRVLFDGTLDGDVYTIAYLTNGNPRNVWSRTLVDSVLATIAPDRFPREALSETLMGYALQPPADGDARAQARSIRTGSTLGDAEFERTINATGYAIRNNLGIEPAIRVFSLNTELFPASANAWDSLAETHAAKGDDEAAKVLYEKARRLSGAERRNEK